VVWARADHLPLQCGCQGLLVLGYVVHRTADSPPRRTVAVLAAIGSIVAVLPPILYALPRFYGG
jgi:hypothetical protein